jgi:VWFA-related protein
MVPAPDVAPSGALNAQPMPGNGAIQLNVVVTDKSGKPVSGLTASDFTLLDNNQPGRILSFHAYDGAEHRPDPPVKVIVLFDTVNTDFDAVSYARQQVENFLRQDGGRLAHPTAIYWLTNDGVQAQDQPTQDGNGLATMLDATEAHLRTVNRSAGAYGAIERFELSVKMLTVVAGNEAKKPGRKLLIWAGPGWPMLESPEIGISNKTQQALFGQIVELSTVLREGQIDLYSVSQGMPGIGTFAYESYVKGVKKPNQVNPPNLGLKVLAVQSGGLTVPPTNDLASSIGICVRDADVFYSLTFEPPPADGPNQYHELRVKVDKPGLTARTNTGYYDQPGGAR